MNKFFLACVPIGNLKEASLLLIETLEKINTIFCEDTRSTYELLQKLCIKNKPKLISCHKYNENNQIDYIILELKKNDVMLVSDAGYPTISDPGNIIVKELISHNIEINVINGPSAFLHALVKSGFNTSNFIFLGFLDNREKQQSNILLKYKKISSTIIFYESVHRLINTINNLTKIFPNNIICVCKELTKKFEKFIYGTPFEILQKIKNIPLKGEFVILIDNNDIEEKEIQIEELKFKLIKLKKYNLSNKDILDILSGFYPKISKKILYNLILGK